MIDRRKLLLEAGCFSLLVTFVWQIQTKKAAPSGPRQGFILPPLAQSEDAIGATPMPSVLAVHECGVRSSALFPAAIQKILHCRLWFAARICFLLQFHCNRQGCLERLLREGAESLFC